MSSLKVKVKSRAGISELTLPGIVRLLCSHAKGLSIQKSPGDLRYQASSKGIAALIFHAEYAGVKIGSSPISGLLSHPPTVNPNDRTLEAIASLLAKWEIVGPNKERLHLSADELREIHISTYSRCLAKDPILELRQEVKDLLRDADPSVLIGVKNKLKSHQSNVGGVTTLSDFIEEGGDDLFRRLNRLVEQDDSVYYASRLLAVISVDKSISGVFDTRQWAVGLIEDACIDTSDSSPEELEAYFDMLRTAVGQIEAGGAPTDVEAVKELIALLSLASHKPYDEPEGLSGNERIALFLEWMEPSSVKKDKRQT